MFEYIFLGCLLQSLIFLRSVRMESVRLLLHLLRKLGEGEGGVKKKKEKVIDDQYV